MRLNEKKLYSGFGVLEATESRYLLFILFLSSGASDTSVFPEYEHFHKAWIGKCCFLYRPFP